MIDAVFLDRDGVVNELLPDGESFRSPRTLSEFHFIEGIKEFVSWLRQKGIKVVIVSNQPEVKRGFVSKETVEAFHARIRSELNIEHIYVCWHDDSDKCECRKPKPGLLLQAAKDLHVDLASSYMIGDSAKDMKAAAAAGCIGLHLGRDYQDLNSLLSHISAREFSRPNSR